MGARRSQRTVKRRRVARTSSIWTAFMAAPSKHAPSHTASRRSTPVRSAFRRVAHGQVGVFEYRSAESGFRKIDVLQMG